MTDFIPVVLIAFFGLIAFALSKSHGRQTLVLKALIGVSALLFFAYLAINAYTSGTNPWIPFLFVFVAISILINAVRQLSIHKQQNN